MSKSKTGTAPADANSTAQILTVTARTILWIEESEAGDRTIAMLRKGVEALGEQTGEPELLTNFDETVDAERKWLEKSPAPTADSESDDTRKRQAGCGKIPADARGASRRAGAATGSGNVPSGFLGHRRTH